MFVKAAALSLALLVASRVLGLYRETVMASAFGATALADVVVLMLTLPDWLAGLLASGALAYVLLPAWAGQSTAQLAASQRYVAQRLLLSAGLLALALLLAVWGWPGPVLRLLAPGLPPDWLAAAGSALVWSALALPAALLAALWSTRLQHARDFVGLYAASLVVNAVLIEAMVLAAWGSSPGPSALRVLGMGLLLAMLARLVWLAWRQRRLRSASQPVAQPDQTPADTADPAGVALPGASLWLWAALSAGLPLTLPFVARSLASGQGDGALAVFNYAWKLVELPLVLAIQLVATLAFPVIVQALARQPQQPSVAARAKLRGAFALAWVLACACAAALLVGAPALAQLLFGWGRMQPDALADIAQWGRAAAWGLLPQSLIAVALTVLAAQGRMRAAVAAYALALLALLVLGALGVSHGALLMAWLNLLYAVVAAICVLSATWAWPREARRAQMLWVRALLLPLLLVGACDALGRFGSFALLVKPIFPGLAACVLAALTVLAGAWWVSPDLRRALRR